MLIVALVLAVIGLAALVTAVVTSNEVVAWVCIAASALGVLLLVVDAIRERQRRATRIVVVADDETTEFVTDAELEAAELEADREAGEEIEAEAAVEDHPEEVVHDEPEYDTYSDDEPEFAESAEESAIHIVDEADLDADPDADADLEIGDEAEPKSGER